MSTCKLPLGHGSVFAQPVKRRRHPLEYKLQMNLRGIADEVSTCPLPPSHTSAPHNPPTGRSKNDIPMCSTLRRFARTDRPRNRSLTNGGPGHDRHHGHGNSLSEGSTGARASRSHQLNILGSRKWHGNVTSRLGQCHQNRCGHEDIRHCTLPAFALQPLLTQPYNRSRLGARRYGRQQAAVTFVPDACLMHKCLTTKQNWGRQLHLQRRPNPPTAITHEVRDFVRRATNIRALGPATHFSTPSPDTTEDLVSLTNLNRVTALDRASHQPSRSKPAPPTVNSANTCTRKAMPSTTWRPCRTFPSAAPAPRQPMVPATPIPTSPPSSSAWSWSPPPATSVALSRATHGDRSR